jgi:hypothetical protein
MGTVGAPSGRCRVKGLANSPQEAYTGAALEQDPPNQEGYAWSSDDWDAPDT